MDKPTSEKDVIKSLDEQRGGLRYRTLPSERARIKPVFDKMLALLKAARISSEDPGSTDKADAFWYNLDATIKEAEELGL